ncbi:MAG: glycoside hydrolase family 2 TIM barrel-domain containing protein [Verrucomicrobiota bacterium]
MRILTYFVSFCLLAIAVDASIVAERVYLSGKGPSDAVDWDFLCSAGNQSGAWTTIPVPSNWEQEGFGNYNYGHDDPATKYEETGTYRTTFFVPESWKNKHVRLVFEGAMTQTAIKVNDKAVGFPNYGGYLPFRYILDKTNLKYGQENTLEVLVKKKPDNESLDLAERKADYWVFGGIYRPVYLEILPREFVNRVAIDARADGNFRMDIFPQVQHPTKFRQEFQTHVDEIVAQIQTLDGDDVGEPMMAPIHGSAGRIQVETDLARPKLWSPEFPNLYQVKITMKHKGETLSEKVERFGFRTFEHRLGDGLYLNGQKIMIKGVNRNVFDAEHGRAVDAERVWSDARAIKAMNANLVRSHMPPTTEFMEACDELGLMVITELCNWHDPVIDTPIARNLVYEMVAKYQNHPSVIIWANGNENGFNLEVDELYHLYDLQNRPIIHPWAYFEGMNTKHYPDYEALLERLSHPKVYLPTEFLHGLYDGGHGAGLEDYWKAMNDSPVSAGGVLWCWADAAIVRTDLDGKLDTYGNKSADGIVGPHGEKEASYFTIREIWSPIQIGQGSLPDDFDGTFPIDNQYYETNLSDRSFEWRLLDLSGPFADEAIVTTRAEGSVEGPDVAPGESGSIAIPLPTDWHQSSALELRALGRDGTEIMKWVWQIPIELEVEAESRGLQYSSEHPLEIKVGGVSWSFSLETGRLLSSSIGGQPTGFGDGPTIYAGDLEKVFETADDWTVDVSKSDDSVVIESRNDDGSRFSWTISDEGSVALDYRFTPIDQALVYCAVGFDLPEDQVVGKRWLGQGPHRIWGNRLKGPQFGLWENAYNDHITGVNWGEPEFKGIFGQVDWMQLALASGASLLVDTDPGTSVGVLHPSNAEGPRNEHSYASPVHAWWYYPEGGGLFFFHKLPGTGTKFANAHELGPQGSPSKLSDRITGRVVFYFDDSKRLAFQ